MAEIIRVGIADAKICKAPNKITTLGLGSCVGVVLYTDHKQIAGLVHILLPSSKEINNNSNKAKFADTGVALMIGMLKSEGLKPYSLMAKIAGGANMFNFSQDRGTGNIGDKNVVAVKEILRAYNIRIVAEDTGKNYGRTIVFDVETSGLLIRSAGKPDKTI